jgi:ADP-heptose:LPS heptosyltransferase
LPLKFKTSAETIPAEIPYIKVSEDLLQKWEYKVKDPDSKFKVGLAWRGNPKHKRDRARSFPLETFAPVAQSDGVVFYSLQVGDVAKQSENPPDAINLINFIDEIRDFADTAAFIGNLDLIISVDTAVAHLAGAVGKPVWTLLPFVPDWRWLLNREDSPWYPTMRLFRQPAIGDWGSVIELVKIELAHERLHSDELKNKR